MSGANPPHKWATQYDWDGQRETISRLYWDESRPLTEVMEIMRSQHNFYATGRMYKFRFKKWGLIKNLKADQDEQIRVQAANGAVAAVPLIRGRLPGSKKLKRYITQLGPETVPESAIHASCVRTPASKVQDGMSRSLVALQQGSSSPRLSISGSLNPPDDVRFTQQSLRAVLDYTTNRVHKGIWDVSGDPYEAADHADNWHNKIFQATGMIQRGKLKEGFRLLNICYRNYTNELDTEHPLLIIETYTSVLHLAKIQYDLAQSLVRYIAGLCKIRLGPAHPFTRFWSSLQAMGVEQIRQAVGVIKNAQFDIFEAYFRPAAEFLIIQNVDSARTLHEAGCIPLSTAEAIISRTIQQRRLDTQRPGADDFICWAKLIIALLLIRNARFGPARAVIDDVGAHMHLPDASNEISLFTSYEYRSIRVHLLRGVGAPHAEMVAALRERLDFCLRTVGPGHHYTTRAFAELDELHRQTGEVEAAERLREDFDFAAQWEAVCRKEEQQAACTSEKKNSC
ncbi:hypothetical protein DL764_004074 [Monosporascus ibericus]|uniref:Clr5 domain-containing protein n=1 Tax=Monosporascus ibericus TaxID=155417 RepID=A0A4Q4TE81_9PEZI|nr:hypothetical protein DL764_004074 [Monosporascus ibericus]